MNSGMFRSQRSTEAPMDFQFTDRPSSHQSPIWRASSVPAEDDPTTPRKSMHFKHPISLVQSFSSLPGPHDTLSPMTPSTPPTFGSNRNIPFMFSTPARSQSQPPAWVPPSNSSHVTSFPRPSSQPPELDDVEMPDASPPKQPEEPTSPETPKSERRVVATGALRRVFRERQQKTRGSRLAVVRNCEPESENEDEYDQSDDEQLQPITQRTSNHYTLNMPSHTPSRSDTPYVLLGSVTGFVHVRFMYLDCHFAQLSTVLLQSFINHGLLIPASTIHSYRSA